MLSLPPKFECQLKEALLKNSLIVLAALALAGCTSSQDVLEACQDKADAWKLKATLALHDKLSQPTIEPVSLQGNNTREQRLLLLSQEGEREIAKAYAEKAAMCEERDRRQ